ncbi:DNA cytosine methyltransferase [Devosia sp.]|uniref:DNA cytosine methyltransferase n=1 Tax=Devosia sp. TaxID=1871048 RepID=UPI001B156CF8|nr:DNA cytosine methyltransferase [Devosia sp.]MBO9589560.1 DNA cytosine methyltransferase [Devosia sp.]
MLVADLLCGAGGSSTGAARALRRLGLEMDLVCVNHWPTAIATHTLNHPEARHFVQDIATVRPHILVPEGYLDLLMASPTCTHHSIARGGKPTSDQQRSDPWHIITWMTELRVKRAIIENVWEFCGWGPVDIRTGKPVKSRKGEYFMAWIDTIKRLGFELEWRQLNAANYGGATTRKRFILKARSDKKLLGWAPLTHAKRSEGNVLQFTDVKPWKSAAEIIDWNIKGRSIYTRKKPLAAKTLARIYVGIVKNGWPVGYAETLRAYMTDLDMPVPVISTSYRVVEPEALVLSQHNSGAARPASEPLPTITTGGAASASRPGCARPMLVEPLVLSQASGGAARPVSEPIPTAPTGGAHALISPYYGSGSGETLTSSLHPLPTITSKGRFGMVVPVTHTQGGNGVRTIDDPLPTITTAKGGEYAVVLPVTHEGGLERSSDARDPLPTITGANRGELAFITAQHGERPGQTPRTHSLSEPVPTIAATGHVDLVEPAPDFDILFRMFEAHELASAMGFNSEDQQYEFAGTKTEKIKQIGNAVSVEMMEAEVLAIMADAASKPVEAAERAVA